MEWGGSKRNSTGKCGLRTLRVHGGLTSELLKHLGSASKTITRLTDADVDDDLLNLDLAHLVLGLGLLGNLRLLLEDGNGLRLLDAGSVLLNGSGGLGLLLRDGGSLGTSGGLSGTLGVLASGLSGSLGIALSGGLGLRLGGGLSGRLRGLHKRINIEIVRGKARRCG